MGEYLCKALSLVLHLQVFSVYVLVINMTSHCSGGGSPAVFTYGSSGVESSIYYGSKMQIFMFTHSPSRYNPKKVNERGFCFPLKGPTEQQNIHLHCWTCSIFENVHQFQVLSCYSAVQSKSVYQMWLWKTQQQLFSTLSWKPLFPLMFVLENRNVAKFHYKFHGVRVLVQEEMINSLVMFHTSYVSWLIEIKTEEATERLWKVWCDYATEKCQNKYLN